MVHKPPEPNFFMAILPLPHVSSSGQSYHHSTRSVYRTVSFNLCCDNSFRHLEEAEMGPPLSFLQVLPAANISCACIVEYIHNGATVHHGCYSHLWTTNYPATIDYLLPIIFCNITLWLDIYCLKYKYKLKLE